MADEAKIVQQRELELANVEAEKAKIAQQRKLELAKVEAEKAKVMADEVKLAKFASQLELGKLGVETAAHA